MLNPWKLLDDTKCRLVDNVIIMSKVIDDVISGYVNFIDNEFDNKRHHFLKDVNADDLRRLYTLAKD